MFDIRISSCRSSGEVGIDWLRDEMLVVFVEVVFVGVFFGLVAVMAVGRDGCVSKDDIPRLSISK